MSKLSDKIKMLKIKKKWTNKYIAERLSCAKQTVDSWTRSVNPVTKISEKNTQLLVELSEGYITLKDCGY